jgi:ATP-dependent 26S proteasome regulatory subunit
LTVGRHRQTPGLLIVAASNRFEDLDPAAVREGRFDYKVKVDNPDFDARLAILRTLSSGEGDSAGDRVRKAVVNIFLAEMDGLDSSTRVFVIGATNRPELLDEALLRPGRLGEWIEIPLPDSAGRKAMLELFSKRMRLAPSEDLEHLGLKRRRVVHC